MIIIIFITLILNIVVISSILGIIKEFSWGKAIFITIVLIWNLNLIRIYKKTKEKLGIKKVKFEIKKYWEENKIKEWKKRAKKTNNLITITTLALITKIQFPEEPITNGLIMLLTIGLTARQTLYYIALKRYNKKNKEVKK